MRNLGFSGFLMIRERQIIFKTSTRQVRKIFHYLNCSIDVDENYSYNRWVVLIETLIILGFAGFYVHYIKKMLETRRLLM